LYKTFKLGVPIIQVFNIFTESVLENTRYIFLKNQG
jgi:hypothetical protein